jgi:hypothetical protein
MGKRERLTMDSRLWDHEPSSERIAPPKVAKFKSDEQRGKQKRRRKHHSRAGIAAGPGFRSV